MHPLQSLIEALDSVSDESEEVNDTDVREQLSEALHGLLLDPRGFQLPQEIGMFDAKGNQRVLTALERFRADYIAAGGQALASTVDADQYIQSPDIVSGRGSAYDEYFGHADINGQAPIAPAKPWWKFW